MQSCVIGTALCCATGTTDSNEKKRRGENRELQMNQWLGEVRKEPFFEIMLIEDRYEAPS